MRKAVNLKLITSRHCPLDSSTNLVQCSILTKHALFVFSIQPNPLSSVNPRFPVFQSKIQIVSTACVFEVAKNMGEIDTKPIEPVQVALTLFGEKSEQRKHRPGNSSSSDVRSSSSGDDVDKEKDLVGVQKDLANYKLQLEAKDAAYWQLLHKLEHYQKTSEELSTQLKNSEVERDVNLEECREARFRIDELEAKIKEMGDQLLESGKLKEQLSHILGELKDVQGELLSMEIELVAATEEKLKALTQAELMESVANMEKGRAEELLKRVTDLNEALLLSKQAAESEKIAEIKERSETEAQAQKQVEDMKMQMEMMQELENKLRDKSVFIDSLQVELNQANELLSSSDKVVSEVINDLNQLKADLKAKEKENSDQAIYIGELETEMNQLKLELKKENEEVTQLNCDVEMLTDELEKVKNEMGGIKERENDAHAEIAILKAELHRARSNIVAAEVSEAKESKKENERLKQGSEMVTEESLDIGLVGNGPENSVAGAEKSRDDNDRNITISLEEYESLISKAAKVNQSATKDLNMLTTYENRNEMETLKKELEVASAKVSEFRTRTEQAVTRAEAAERAKLALEDQLRKWREQKKRRKAALAALREESLSREFGSSSYGNTPINYQPLGKVLNMKF